MGLLDRLDIAAQVISGFLGLARVPTDPEERRARVEELYQQARGEFPDVTEAEAADLLGAGGVVFVDVRPERERAISVLPGSIPAAVVEADPAAFEGQRLVAYCTIGYRSGLWATAQRERGLPVENLAGGVLAWSWAGGTFERDGEPTTTVHVFGPSWDLLAPGFTSTW